MPKKPKIVGIIPAYNEENSIGNVVAQFKKYVDEIIVIDDGSKDKTVLIAQNQGAIVYSNITNRGLGYSIKKGYKKALEHGADIIVQTDADGQYTLEDTPKLIQPILENKADMVLASRMRGGIESMPLPKRIGNTIGTIVTRFVSGARITDAQTGFRAIRKEVLEEIIPSNRYTYVQEMIIKVAKEGWRIREVPSFFKKRYSGNSRLIANLYSYASEAILIIIRSVIEYHPLRFFGYPGTLLLITGLLLGLYLFYRYYIGIGVATRIGLVVFTAFLMLTGLLLIFIGFLADTIQQRFKELKK